MQGEVYAGRHCISIGASLNELTVYVVVVFLTVQWTGVQ